MLSLYSASNCVLSPLIIPLVTTFGQALRELRGKRTGIEIAIRALADSSTKKQRRDFANYLSKIENDRVPNVGLGRLRLIAKGMGLQLDEFFVRIGSATKESSTAGLARDTTVGAPSEHEVVVRADTPVPDADEVADLQRLVNACLAAAEVSDRAQQRTVFEDLAVGFEKAIPGAVKAREIVRQRRAR